MAMASGNSSAQQHGGDRLSDLEDGLLGTILSFLPIKDAARAAALARRYRHAFAGVNTTSFVEQEAHSGLICDDYTFCVEAVEKRSKNGDFMVGFNAALLCRRRCAGDTNAASRTFRVNLGCFNEWDEAMVSQWLSLLLKRSTGQELHVDLRLQLTVMGDHNFDGQEWGYRGADDADGDCPAHSKYEAQDYELPTRLFSCLALRTLCLGGFSLDPPDRINLPFLETLVPSSIPSCDNIQRLISACPRLVDLTLERCGYTPTSSVSDVDRTYTITVVDKRLRRLALRCCHNLARVGVDASELQTFEYRGSVPAELLLTLHGAHNISSCTIGFCGRMVYVGELPRFRKFLEQFAGGKQLHLESTHLGADIESEVFTTAFPAFPTLTRLQLTGYLHRGSIEALARILRQAPGVEVLSLFMKQRSRETFNGVCLEQCGELGDDELGVSSDFVSIPCLRNRVREINLVHYEGLEEQRYAARLLLCNAMVLERLCVVFPIAPLELQMKLPHPQKKKLQMKLKDEIQGWVLNTSSTETIFL